MTDMEETIRKYFRAWIDADAEAVEGLFSDSIVYSECYGPEYRGLAQIMRWFDDWNRRGRVTEWSIKRIITQERTLAAEWHFECVYDGNADRFDGVTIADFDSSGRIFRLSEFQSKSEHYFPYGRHI